MVKKTTIAIAAAAAALVIGGGVGIATAANLDGADRAANVSDTVLSRAGDTTTPSSTPTPSETPWTYTEVDNGEATFLGAIKSPYTINGIDMPDDEQLLADAREACRQLASGVTFDSVAVIADDPNPDVTNGQRVHATNSRQLAGLASETLCTEYSQLNVPPPAGPDGQ